MLVKALKQFALPDGDDEVVIGETVEVGASLGLVLILQGLAVLQTYEEGEIVQLVDGGLRTRLGGSFDAAKVVLPSQVAGAIARFHVADQSDSRTRLEFPSGAKAIRIFYSARKSTNSGAEVRDALGEALKVVFNIEDTTEAGNALAESAASPGDTIAGVSYLLIPIDTSYEAAFPDPDDRLYYVDFLSAVAETGDSDVIVEVTL